MTREEISYIKDVYDECVIKGLLYPEKLRKAASIILGLEHDTIMPIPKCKQTIYSFVQYSMKTLLNNLEDMFLMKDILSEDETETNLPTKSETLSVNNEEQSHEEKIDVEENRLIKTDKDKIDDVFDIQIMQQIVEFQKKYDNTDNPNMRRSLKMKINSLKRKLQ